MTDDPDVSDRVPAFVYLDMDRVKSLSARIDQGYIREQVEEREESEETAESIYSSIKAQIFGGVGPSAEVGAEVSSSSSESNISQETKALHHYYYDMLESWLQQAEGDWFHDVGTMSGEVGGAGALPGRFRDRVGEGDLILVRGPVYFVDFRTSTELIDGFFDAISLLEDFQIDAIREQLSGTDLSDINLSEISQMGFAELKPLKPLFETMQVVLPEEYKDILVMQLAPISQNHEFQFWSTVQRNKLETTPVELLSRHQSSMIQNCTMLARVENVTEKDPDQADIESSEESGDEEEDEDFQFGELLHLADELATQFNLKVDYPQVSVTPIAVYR